MRKTFLKSQVCTQTLTPPKNLVNFFENQKLNAPIQAPTQYSFHQYTSFTKYLYFLRYGLICLSMSHIFHPSKFELFDLKNPKILTLYFSFLVHNPQPKLNQKSPKDPKLILILTMKQVHTYFSLTLPR